MSSGCSPSSSSTRSRNSFSFSKGTPFRQPIPTTSFRGIRVRHSFGASASGKPIIPSGMPVSSAAPSPGCRSTTFSGTLPENSADTVLRRRIFLPESSFPDTRRTASRFPMRSPFRRAKSSMAKHPFTSVAVVMAGSAPMRAPISRASALAPPMCPDRRGMIWFPRSSITSTGLSCSLSCTRGAAVRRAIPAAPTKSRG